MLLKLFINKFRIYLKLIIFLNFTNILNCIWEGHQIGKIIIKDGVYLAEEYEILKTNKNNIRIDKKLKICSVINREAFENNCMAFNKIYYDKWVRLKSFKNNMANVFIIHLSE